MHVPRIRLSTLLVSLAVIAGLLAFWRLNPQDTFLVLIPFELLVLIPAIILVT
ncbi:hypothetical protein [Tautonia rosea]|uniref:hypothetical protein n=1 Tax=Tautonia rosea TaxID=2728037 RepID=UPI00147662DE|nr:hypothetical protein [Tautonia rosea]